VRPGEVESDGVEHIIEMDGFGGVVVQKSLSRVIDAS
jgi:hypothetical protein